MAGRHRRQGYAVHVQIPEKPRRVRSVSVVDARTRVEHLVTDDVLAAPRLNYLAECGAQVLAASLTDPGRGWCRDCAR
jgi:hypothetical protein